MLTRRVFLQNTLSSAAALPLLANAGGVVTGQGINSAGKVLIFSEESCTDSRAFSRSLPVRSLNADPSVQLLELKDSFAAGEFDSVMGLTRNSNYFLIDQIAIREGYFTVYKGVHDYQPDGLIHELHGDPALVSTLAGHLALSDAQWAPALARASGALCVCRALEGMQRVATDIPRPKDSPGYLVSWVLQARLA